ncbi:MAG: NAD(P)/FAD-dependent oxidoreductase [Flavipsychrobacter sp.]
MMERNTMYDVIIVGGSYAGLSAAMSLGRSLKKVLVIDSGLPCNRQTPYSHNMITHDGTPPAAIAAAAKKQVQAYDTVKFYEGLAIAGKQIKDGFEIKTEAGDVFTATKLIFATGVKDIFPDIDGFSACWGISILHCPYCHGYEVRMEETGILANGDAAFNIARMISNWTDKLTVFTNGKQELLQEQVEELEAHNIKVVEKEVAALQHKEGYLTSIQFADGSTQNIKAIYARPVNVQHCTIPEQLGCELGEDGLLLVDPMQQTTIEGVYACGDNANWARSVAIAIAAGVTAGTALNREMILEAF